MIGAQQFAYCGLAGSSIIPCTFSGTFNQSGAGPTITSTTCTITVPSGNSGDVRISGQIETGAVAFEYSKNAAAFANAEVNPTVVTFANGDTLAFRITGAASGEDETWTLTDVTTGLTIGTFTISCP